MQMSLWSCNSKYSLGYNEEISDPNSLRFLKKWFIFAHTTYSSWVSFGSVLFSFWDPDLMAKYLGLMLYAYQVQMATHTSWSRGRGPQRGKLKYLAHGNKHSYAAWSDRTPSTPTYVPPLVFLFLKRHHHPHLPWDRNLGIIPGLSLSSVFVWILRSLSLCNLSLQ